MKKGISQALPPYRYTILVQLKFGKGGKYCVAFVMFMLTDACTVCLLSVDAEKNKTKLINKFSLLVYNGCTAKRCGFCHFTWYPEYR